jgi:hypothetical protein
VTPKITELIDEIRDAAARYIDAMLEPGESANRLPMAMSGTNPLHGPPEVLAFDSIHAADYAGAGRVTVRHIADPL